MPDTFILIPGRSSRQGVALNEGKYTDNYLEEIATLRMNPDDMTAMQVVSGDRIRVWNTTGEFIAPCADARDELPRGMLFIAYGNLSCRVMPSDTHGSGMPDSKGLDVFAEPAATAAAAPENAEATTSGISPAAAETSASRLTAPVTAAASPPLTVAMHAPSAENIAIAPRDPRPVRTPPATPSVASPTARRGAPLAVGLALVLLILAVIAAIIGR